MSQPSGNALSRSAFLRTAGILSAGLLLQPRRLFAQESPVPGIIRATAKAPIIPHKLRNNITLLEGSGGNITVCTGRDGVLMVDAGIAVSQQKIVDAIAAISPLPVKFLINTHWHFDHVDGNEWIHNKGATIIAHQNTLANLSRTIRIEDWYYTFPPLPTDARPTITFSDVHHMRHNNSNITLTHYQPAHTNGDIAVYFAEADVLHVADTWWNGHYPYIDHGTGGSLDGMIKACHHNLAATTSKSIIVPGHGPAGNQTQLKQYLDMLLDCQQRIGQLKKQGRTVEETIAARPTAAYDRQYGNFLVDGAFFTRLVYADV